VVLTLSLLAYPNTSGAQPVDDGAEDEPPPPANWTFKDDSKSVKVIVLAGSIGATRSGAYHQHLEAACSNTEFVNLSKAGHAVQGLLKIWRHEVSTNRRLLRSRQPGEDHWTLFGGGLNNIGTSGHHSAAHAMRKLFLRMHKDDFDILATSLTPWGDRKDKRWVGYTALLSHRTTLALGHFVGEQLSPQDALGRYLKYRQRSSPKGTWEDDELPDQSIDLYSSDLRHKDAAPTDAEETRKTLLRSRMWRRATGPMDPASRANQLQLDAEELAGLPRWYLRPDLQGFDPIHPNRTGHRLMAQIMCPSLPSSWGCDCQTLSSVNSPD